MRTNGHEMLLPTPTWTTWTGGRWALPPDAGTLRDRIDLHGADALGMAGQVGTLAQGAYADLIAVEDDPLNDIRALERVSVVLKGGEIVNGGVASTAR